MTKKAMISMPMNGKHKCDIEANFNRIKAELESKGYEVIDSVIKDFDKKEFDLHYQKMLNLIIEKNDLKFAEFMYKMSDFFANVLSESQFNETTFELREKFYEYLTDKFTL